MTKMHFLANMERVKEFSKLPLVELVGTDRVLIENHQGVLSYSLEEIVVQVIYGKISVAGDQLKLLQIDREQLVITGKIGSIHLCRR